MNRMHHQKTVLITGAARRLGREIALALAAGGWQVAVHYRESAKEAAKTVADCEQLAGASAAFRADLQDEMQVRNLLPNVIEHFGSVDAVVNSASTFEYDIAASFSFSAMEKHMRSNVGAAIILAQALHEHRSHTYSEKTYTPAFRAGVVVNLLDQKLWNPNPDFLSYTLSKAAMEAATKLLAQALAPQVRVVGVAPGLTLSNHLLTDEQFKALHRISPLGKSSTAEDVAATVKFAIDNQSITGTTLLVDGGQHLLPNNRDFSFM